MLFALDAIPLTEPRAGVGHYVALSIVVSYMTQPKTSAELKGLVYSETPKEQRTDPEAARLPWYQSPTTLAGISLVLVIALNIIFR